MYDENGNLLQKTDARGTITYEYDPLNRIERRSYAGGPSPTPLVTSAYDAPGVPYSKGRLTSVTSTVSSYGYDEYDPMGRVKRSSQVTDQIQYPMRYEYDLAGNMTTQTYPSGMAIRAEYDLAGRVAGLKNQAGSYYAGAAPADANKIDYASHGAVNVMRLGNGRWEHTIFNARMQPIEIGLDQRARARANW